MSKKLTVVKSDSKALLTKAKNLVNITNKILANKNSTKLVDTEKNIKISTYLEKELFKFKKDLDISDYKIMNNLMEDSTSLFESINEEELSLWIINLKKCTSYDVNYLIGNCITLAFCKYSLVSLSSDTKKILINKVSNELKKIIQTINSF